MMFYAILLSVALQVPPAGEAKPQSPPATQSKPQPKRQLGFYDVAGIGERIDPTKPETLDQQIQRAMATHPDLRIAQLQVELAQAKLEQERQRVAQRISAAGAEVDSLKSIIQKQTELYERLRMSGAVTAELNPVLQKLAESKRELAAAEVELQAAVGANKPVTFQVPPETCPAFKQHSGKAVSCTACHDNGTVCRIQPEDLNTADVTWSVVYPAHQKSFISKGVPFTVDFKFANSPEVSKGFLVNFPEMMASSVTLDKKTGTPHDLLTEILAKAAGGKPVPIVRTTSRFDPKVYKQPTISLVGDSDELGSWLQQYIDALNTSFLEGVENPRPKYNVYVRNYGLLVASEAEAPTNASTVFEYWKAQYAVEQAAKTAKKTAVSDQAVAEAQAAFKAAQEVMKERAEKAPPPKPKD